MLRGDRAEQALAKIKINKGHQQLLSRLPDVQNQIKLIDDELKELRNLSVDSQSALLNEPRRKTLIKRRAQL